jgi:hypothetical protein
MNNYIIEDVKRVVLKLWPFFAIIIKSFRHAGSWLRIHTKNMLSYFFIWIMGVSLFAYCIYCTSIIYFDLLVVIWFWLITILSARVNISAYCGVGSGVTKQESTQHVLYDAETIEPVRATI